MQAWELQAARRWWENEGRGSYLPFCKTCLAMPHSLHLLKTTQSVFHQELAQIWCGAVLAPLTPRVRNNSESHVVFFIESPQFS